MPSAVTRSREWTCVPLTCLASFFVILGHGGEENHLNHVQGERSWSGRWLRQGSLQTEERGGNGNKLKGGGKKGGSCPPSLFCFRTSPLPSSPGGDNSHTEGLKLCEGSFGLMKVRREGGRMSLGLPVSNFRGTEKLEELRTLKTSPGTQQFYLLAGNWGYTTNITYSHTVIVKPVNQMIKYRLSFCLSWRLKESGRNKNIWFIYLFVCFSA